ncbi:hypothetical protein SADUNF_Sadunf11G0069600 [Salix dunnii]|uniref:Uncharacterized protein n=1 Tax=Salix dunnii TaxID=1413687 RepID=A0A835JP25_9ROSI|nr:hypothetical protein SADUNF_Sadunf11G0069600 [Salix dunnii]
MCLLLGGLGRNLHSKIQWFTRFCNSHQVSYFAMFFIDVRIITKRRHSPNTEATRVCSQYSIFLALLALGFVGESCAPKTSLSCHGFVGHSTKEGFDNDPSTGSSTKTLLRLLLPLNDKVQWTSCDVAAIQTLHRTIQLIGVTSSVYKG